MSRLAAGSVIGVTVGLFIQILFFYHYFINNPVKHFQYNFVANGMMVNFATVITIFILMTVIHHWLMKYKFYQQTE